MGYTPGKGLGKYGTGIAEPINESIHKGRRGFGYTLEGLEREDVEWELEEVSCCFLFIFTGIFFNLYYFLKLKHYYINSWVW